MLYHIWKKKFFWYYSSKLFFKRKYTAGNSRMCVTKQNCGFTRKIWSMWNIDFGSVRLGSWELSTRPNELKGFKQAWLSNCMKKKSKNIMIWIHKIDRRTIWSYFGLFCPIWEKKCSQKQFTTFIIQKFWKI